MSRWVELHGSNAGNLINLVTSAYVDGINHRIAFFNIPQSWASEVRRPALSTYHLSFFQAANDGGGLGNVPHGGPVFNGDVNVNMDATGDHTLWTDQEPYQGLGGIPRPQDMHNNRFVHSNPYEDDGWKERIDDQQPIMYFIGERILQRFQG